MSPARLAVLTLLALVAFAGNSLLCRAALTHGGIDAASFTLVRLLSGAVVLALLARLRTNGNGHGNWRSALALFAYAAAFSYAYLQLTAATGALLLFGAVQATMIAHGLRMGERMRFPQWCGLMLACGGLVGLVLPGLSAPPLSGALLMLGAGVAWGVYSLRGRGMGDPLRVTAGNFLRAVPMAALIAFLLIDRASLTAAGAGYAVLSGALASGVGLCDLVHGLAAFARDDRGHSAVVRSGDRGIRRRAAAGRTADAALAACVGCDPGWDCVGGGLTDARCESQVMKGFCHVQSNWTWKLNTPHA